MKGNNSFHRRRVGKEMTKIAVQIYEIQDPHEAEKLIGFGVDHLGSVILSEERWKVPSIKETMQITEGTAAKNSLIPLFNTPDTVFRGIRGRSSVYKFISSRRKPTRISIKK